MAIEGIRAWRKLYHHIYNFVLYICSCFHAEAFGGSEQNVYSCMCKINQQIESGLHLLFPLLTLASWGWITSWSGWRITFSAAGRGISPDPPRGKTGEWWMAYKVFPEASPVSIGQTKRKITWMKRTGESATVGYPSLYIQATNYTECRNSPQLPHCHSPSAWPPTSVYVGLYYNMYIVKHWPRCRRPDILQSRLTCGPLGPFG